MTLMDKLRGKVAVITGGAAGIGFAIAKRFVDEGAFVFIAGRRQKEIDEAVKRLGNNVVGVRGDVSKLQDLDSLYATVGYAAGRKTTIDVTDLIWKRARIAGFSLFAQTPCVIAAAWRDVIPLMVAGSIKPIVESVYAFSDAGAALRHLIEDRPFGKVVLKG
jgi:NADPH:quinone reductase